MAITARSGMPGEGMSLVSLPRGVNVAALSSGSGQCRPRAGNSLKLSNLDLNDRLVKKGRMVSYHGFRGLVLRVRTGKCLVSFSALCRSAPAHGWPDQWLVCESVQVVA